jgi:hypothetical protein
MLRLYYLHMDSHMLRILISIPESLKRELDSLRLTDTSASGLIRHLLFQYFSNSVPARPGRRRKRSSSAS